MSSPTLRVGQDGEEAIVIPSAEQLEQLLAEAHGLEAGGSMVQICTTYVQVTA